MKGDFSRIRFNRRKSYTAVLEQQGRVALDADANEQCFIDEYLRRSEVADLVGDYGGSACDAGFEITVVNEEILIGPGRYYVDGLLCDNPAGLSYDRQPFLLDPAPSGTTLLTALASASGADVLQVYLEVWQRLVTELDDPCLRESALGQADTTARLQTVWRVIAELTTPGTENQPAPGLGPAGMTPCCKQMYATASQPSTGTMSAGTSGPLADCECEPIAAAGYQGIENQLYRVEIHTPGDETTATFKWSRENASVVSAVTGISGTAVQLNSLGPDANLGFQAQQWVELSDDTYLFGEDPNRPGTLYQIQSIQPADLSLTLMSRVTGVDPGQNARIRRWDQTGPSAAPSGIPLSVGSWLQLENGIQVRFNPGSYQSGDYWTIPARTASGQIDWPPCGGDGNAFQPPYYMRVYRAPLACIHCTTIKEIFGDRETVIGGYATVDDCRQLFSPLTSLSAPATRQAIHVEDISWINDNVVTLDQLVATGLTITLDQAPTSPVTGANFIVTVEPATGLPAADDQTGTSVARDVLSQLPSTILRGVTIIDAKISVSGQTLSWQPPYEGASYLQRATIVFLDELLSPGAAVGWFARVRVKLLGQMIFATGASGPMFLDGRAFGQLASQGTPQRISLQLPSGEGAVASDFDAWFYLAPTLQIVSVTPAKQELTVLADDEDNVTGVSATGPSGPPVSAEATVTVNYPATVAVTLALDGETGVGTVASIPATAPLDGQTSYTFPITILANPGEGAPLTFAITASLSQAVGPASAKSATFTVAGALNRSTH